MPVFNPARKFALKSCALLIAWGSVTLVCFRYFEYQLSFPFGKISPIYFSILYNPIFVIAYLLITVDKVNLFILKKFLSQVVLISLVAVGLPLLLVLQFIQFGSNKVYTVDHVFVLAIASSTPLLVSVYLFSTVKKIEILKKFAISVLFIIATGIVIVNTFAIFVAARSLGLLSIPYSLFLFVLSYVSLKFLVPLFQLLEHDAVLAVLYKMTVGLFIAGIFALITACIFYSMGQYVAYVAVFVLVGVFIISLFFFPTKNIKSYCIRTACSGPFALLILYLPGLM